MPPLQNHDVHKTEKPNARVSSGGSTVPRLRTYASDMSRAIRARGETVASIVGAEKKARGKEPNRQPSPERTRSVLLLLGAVALPVIGVLVIIGTLIITAEPEPLEEVSPGIVFSNETVLIAADDRKSLSDVLAVERTNANLLLGEVQRFIVTAHGAALSPQDLALALGFPDTVAREVTGAMVGVHAFNRNQPFVIFEVVTYDRTFNALLEWEPLSARELGAFFAPLNPPSPVPRLSYTDLVLRNLDVRLSDPAWPILYAFPSRTMLIVTTNEFTLREIMTRLGNSSR